ncbi:hypothetical protein N431DRAFT_160156 [Stipitochalara longipes BDJ]|nr:hypothetical protein N431DRAFT_160156 [Stipitochalara longipes BDJ]
MFESTVLVETSGGSLTEKLSELTRAEYATCNNNLHLFVIILFSFKSERDSDFKKHRQHISPQNPQLKSKNSPLKLSHPRVSSSPLLRHYKQAKNSPWQRRRHVTNPQNPS